MSTIFSKLYYHPNEMPVEGEQQEQVLPVANAEVLQEQSVWEIIARWGVYGVAFLTPLWFLPLTISPVDTNKAFLVSLLAIVGFIAWLGTAVYRGVFTIPRTAPLYALGVWVIVYFLASLFSVSPEVSFWGSSATSFFHIAIGVLITLMTAVTLRTARDMRRVHLLLFVAAAIAAIFMVVQTLFGIDIFQWEFAKERTFHPVGVWNTVGIFFCFILVSAMPLISGEGFSRTIRICVTLLTMASLVLAAAVNFRLLWVGVALVCIIYLAYHYSRPGDWVLRMRSIAWPMALLLLSVLLYLSQDIMSMLALSFNPPLDVTPSVSSSLQIARDVLRDNPLFGVGPNLFGYAWDRFKDPTVNTTIFWRLRFGTASSFATTILSTTGILGMITFLAFVGSIVSTGFFHIRKLQWELMEHRFLAGSFFGLLFLLFSWFIYPMTVSISLLTFFALGSFIAQMRQAGMISTVAIPIRADSAKGFGAALGIMFLMVFGVVGLYVASKKYVAAIVYGRGVVAFDTDGAVNEAEHLFRRATEFDNSRDQYYRALAQMSSVKLQRSLTDAANQPPEDVRSAFQMALSEAIKSAQTATLVHPGDSANWRLLGQIYESVIPFVGGAADAAIAAYQEAINRSPSDPVLREDIAREYIALGDYVKARESLEEAVRLKNDYAAAHFRLAQIAAIKGNVDDAVSNTERAALSAPNDVGILFQLGLLYYRQGRNRDAQQVLERAVSINPNYSNARYFLGLAYAAREERDLAIEQFRLIQELNPDNVEVKHILTNLTTGREALDGITPPPLNRDEVPVRKEGEELDADQAFEERIPATDEQDNQ